MKLYFKPKLFSEGIYDENNNLKYRLNYMSWFGNLHIRDNDNNKILTLKREKNIFRFISNDNDTKEIKIKTKAGIVPKMMSSDESIIGIPNQKFRKRGEYNFFKDGQRIGTIENKRYFFILNRCINISEQYYNKETELFFLSSLLLILRNFYIYCFFMGVMIGVITVISGRFM